MKYTTKAAEKSTVKVTMQFDGEEWKAAQTKAYMKSRGRFAINGFRKGKAPKNVIENVYGKGVFYEDALNSQNALRDPLRGAYGRGGYLRFLERPRHGGDRAVRRGRDGRDAALPHGRA